MFTCVHKAQTFIVSFSFSYFCSTLSKPLYGLFPMQQFVPRAAGMEGCVWLQESAAARRDGWVVPAIWVSTLFPKTDNVLLCTFDETGLKNNRGVSDVRSRVMTPILMLALHWEHLFLMIKSFSFHPVPVLSALLTTLHHSHTSAFYIPDFSLCTLDLLFSLVYFQMSQHFTPLRPAAGVYDARIYKLFTHFPFPWFYK